jgi:hypothetical protein
MRIAIFANLITSPLPPLFIILISPKVRLAVLKAGNL